MTRAVPTTGLALKLLSRQAASGAERAPSTRSLKTTRARWRLRDRRASRQVLALGSLARDERLGRRVMPRLDEGDHVERAVELAVAATVEPHPGRLTRADAGMGATPASIANASAERKRRTSPDLADELRGGQHARALERAEWVILDQQGKTVLEAARVGHQSAETGEPLSRELRLDARSGPAAVDRPRPGSGRRPGWPTEPPYPGASASRSAWSRLRTRVASATRSSRASTSSWISRLASMRRTGGRSTSRAATRAIASASPGSLLPARRVRWPLPVRSAAAGPPARRARLRRVTGRRARRRLTSPRPRSRPASSSPIAHARSARWPAGSLAKVRSSSGLPSSSMSAARECGLVGIDPDRAHRPSSAARAIRWARARRAAVRRVEATLL